LTALSGGAYARFMTRRSRWLGIASIAIALTSAPQAAARLEPKAKFKIVSASGREALSFQEDGTTSTGTRCVGSTESEVRWRMTKPLTVYVFVYRYGGRPGTSLSTDRVGKRYDAVPIVGQATMSRAVDYSETAGCDEEPTNCPEATAPAEPFLTGTLHGPTSVNAGIDVVHVPRGFDPSCLGYGGSRSASPHRSATSPCTRFFPRSRPRRGPYHAGGCSTRAEGGSTTASRSSNRSRGRRTGPTRRRSPVPTPTISRSRSSG
jgi:hypothetical protein